MQLTITRSKSTIQFLTIVNVFDQNFLGGGVVDGEGGSSERCLKWGGGGH